MLLCPVVSRKNEDLSMLFVVLSLDNFLVIDKPFVM